MKLPEVFPRKLQPSPRYRIDLVVRVTPTADHSKPIQKWKHKAE